MIRIDGKNYSSHKTLNKAIMAYFEDIIAEGRAEKYRPDGAENTPSVFYDVKVSGLCNDYYICILNYYDLKNAAMRDVVVKATVDVDVH